MKKMLVLLTLALITLQVTAQTKKLGPIPQHFMQSYQDVYHAAVKLEEAMGNIPKPSAEVTQAYLPAFQEVLNEVKTKTREGQLANAAKQPCKPEATAMAALTGLDLKEVCLVVEVKQVMYPAYLLLKTQTPRGAWLNYLREMHWGDYLDFEKLPSTEGMPAEFVTAVENYRKAGLAFRKSHEEGKKFFDKLIKSEKHIPNKNALGIRLAVHESMAKTAGRSGLIGKWPLANYEKEQKVSKNMQALADKLEVPTHDIAYLYFLGGRPLKKTIKTFTWLPQAEEIAKSL